MGRRALYQRRLRQPPAVGSLRQACIRSALIPGARLGRVRREAKDAKVPKRRIIGRAEHERSMDAGGRRGLNIKRADTMSPFCK